MNNSNTEAIEWYDKPVISKEKKVYTDSQYNIPGLRMIGIHNASHATASLEPHYHKNCFEFTYIVHGNVRFSVNDTSYPLSGGDIYVTHPDEIHDTGKVPLSLHHMYWFQLDASNPENLLYLNHDAAETILHRLFALKTRVIKLDNRWAEMMFAQIIDGIESGTELGNIRAAQLISVLLCEIIENAESPSFKITPDIGRATEFILQHIDEDIPLEKLASISLLSVSHFKQKFKSEMGTSPRSFINFHKIEMAKELLAEGTGVTDTAMKLSFSSSNYFSGVFKRYTMMSPTEYIKYIGTIENNHEDR